MIGPNVVKLNIEADIAVTTKIAAASIAAGIIFATLAWETAHYFAMPVQDDIFDRLKFYRALPGGLWRLLSYYVSAHNEHRIATTRLFATIDEILFRGTEYTQIISTNIIQLLITFIVFNGVFRKYIGINWAYSHCIFVFMCICLLFINPNLFYTLLVPFQLQHALLAFLVILSAMMISRFSRLEMSAAEEARVVVGLLALGALGTFTLGNSPAILIAATIAAAAMRWRVRFILLLGALAVAHTAIVLATTKSVTETTNNAVEILKFCLIYLGSPFLRFGPWPASYVTWDSSVLLAAAFGVAVLAGAIVFGVARLLKPSLGGPTAIFGFVLLVAVIVTGVAAAHSRAQFGILEAANKKYASFAALGWLGLLAVCVGIADERIGRHRWAPTCVFTAFLGVMIPLSVLGYARETRIWQKMIDRNWEDGLAVFLHINDAARLNEIYVEKSGLAEYVGYIEPRGRSIFAYFPFRWGDDASSVLDALSPTGCRSEVETLDPIAKRDLTDLFQEPGTAVTISGWAWMDADRAPPGTVIAVDARNRIVGAARITRPGSRAEEWLGQKMSENVGWFGFARVTEPPPVTFFALSRDGKTYCALGSVGNVNSGK
jgi:hypothetical protein